jgi:type IV pilus assembly protein PilP
MTAVFGYETNRLSIFLLPISLLVLLASNCLASQNSQTTIESSTGSEDAVELNFEITKSDFQYQIGNRPDPFVPFFTGEVSAGKQPDPNEILEVEKRLTGMQLFEPGQLTLVALMAIKGAYYAMVEDFKGQGYIIEEGTKIGKRGVVKDIQANKVLIEEVAVTRSGKELRNEIVMALRKEGEE